MTPADHANTVREALTDSIHDWDAHAALDALQAQAEEYVNARATVKTEGMTRASLVVRAEALKAERDRLAEILSRVKQDARADGNTWLVEFIDAALDHTEQP